MLATAKEKAHLDTYVHIEDEERLKIEIKSASKRSTGLFSMLAKDGRGIDFKFLCEAKVLIIFNGKLMFRHSDIAQIAGRGNRSQGLPSALVIMTSAAKGTDPQSILDANSVESAGNLPDMIDNVYNKFEN